ncbi:MAG TPA: amidase [Geminicoccus sp.]|jgi:amidase/aspartyl-tRNA(Asn)/glutamyl-tRNA(Gln) amidotransferase subunit A|uniref:amidase n=1 Tax=Geminicoccus sp. TaxID=2024832 RepID=UPI002E35EADF|nr:amidase [Geminicoccus sp.]HEX2529026.1 amidase [Geminicoccus sp.]
MRDLLESSALALSAAFRRGTISPLDVMDATLAQIDRMNGKINALWSIRAEAAREAARAAEARFVAREPLGALDGLPVTLKDSIHVNGWPYRHGTAANEDRPPSTFDAPPAARTLEAGGIVLAKTTMPDFGLLAAGVSSAFGIVRNPWDATKNTGGSSAGAGAALAGGLCHLAVGTDIAGSVRLPAAHCGVVALKPTQGRVPHLVPSTTRSAGPMARSVADVAFYLSVLSRFDARDSGALPADGIRYHERLQADLRGRRVGLLLSMGYGAPVEPVVEQVVQAAARALEAAGAIVEPVDPPFGHDAYQAIDRTLQVRGLAEYRSFTPEQQVKVLAQVAYWSLKAERIDGAAYQDLLNTIEASKQELHRAIGGYDLLLTPTLPCVSFPADRVGLDEATPLAHATFTAWFNQTGQPALSLPFGHDRHNHPIGVQLVGRRFDDLGVLQAGAFLEQARGRMPDWPF